MCNDIKDETIEKVENVVCTRMNSIRFKKMWVIEDYMQNESYEFPIFSSDREQKFKWRLQLSCRNYDYFASFVPYLILLPCNISVDLIVMITYSVQYANGEKTNFATQSYQNSILPNEITEYLCKKDCFELQSDDDGRGLTIFCDIEVIFKGLNLLNDSPAIEVPICDIVDNIGHFLESKELSDVTINVCGHEFTAHKNILAMRSRVFLAMFVNEMVEKQTNRVDITDVEPEIFKEILRFIYTGQAPNVDKITEKLLVAAEKYHLERLKIMCEEALRVKITIDNAADMLMLADIHNAKYLKKLAVNFITGSNLAKILITEGFHTLSKSHPILMAELLRAVADVKEM